MSGSPSSSAAADAGGGGGGPVDLGGRRASDPTSSSSRPRSAAEAVWPEHFVEAVAVRVAVDAAQTEGRLAAAPAIATVFRVCSTWRSVSLSELLWEEVSRRVWSRHHHRRSLPSWSDEFRRLHHTALNFRVRRCSHAHILPPSGDISSCRRLALSDSHLAAGFSDGTVRLFHLPTGQHLSAFGPHPEQARLGLFGQSISGLSLLSDSSGGDRLVFAFQDGDVHVASLHVGSAVVRRANVGNPVDDGPLVDFTCDSSSRWWVGLFAGVPGRSWHVWDGQTEQLVYVGGSLTEPDAMAGWRVLADLRGPAVGRVRIPEAGIAVGCTGSRMQVIELEVGEVGSTVGYLEFRRGAVVETVDGCDGQVVVLDGRRMGKVRRARGLEEVCRFSARRRGHQQEEEEVVAGCMNWGYVVICSGGGGGGGGGGGEMRMWDAVTGENLYRFRERIGLGTVVVASDRYVSAWSADTGLHTWDFAAGF